MSVITMPLSGLLKPHTAAAPPVEPTAYVVSGVTTGYQGTYPSAGTFNGVTYFQKDATHFMYRGDDGTWYLYSSLLGNPTPPDYYNTTVSNTPPLGTWLKAGAPGASATVAAA